VRPLAPASPGARGVAGARRRPGLVGADGGRPSAARQRLPGHCRPGPAHRRPRARRRIRGAVGERDAPRARLAASRWPAAVRPCRRAGTRASPSVGDGRDARRDHGRSRRRSGSRWTRPCSRSSSLIERCRAPPLRPRPCPRAAGICICVWVSRQRSSCACPSRRATLGQVVGASSPPCPRRPRSLPSHSRAPRRRRRHLAAAGTLGGMAGFVSFCAIVFMLVDRTVSPPSRNRPRPCS
jgi:hypothetical protein